MDERRRRFEALVLPHLDAAYRFARWLSPSPGDADDIVQEAILRAFRGFDALRGSDAKAWLLTIVKNCHLTALQQQQRYVEVRSCKYLNNIVEQDHRAIKRRCASMKGFKSFTNAAITIAGIELAHRIHKRQFSFGLGRPRRNLSLKVRWQRALA